MAEAMRRRMSSSSVSSTCREWSRKQPWRSRSIPARRGAPRADCCRIRAGMSCTRMTSAPISTAIVTISGSSRAEWSVAKNGYVVGQSGWFSCRSACYLAAGRPVVVQDTGFSKVLPTGTGIVPFSTLQEAIDGIRDVESRYDIHRKAARDIAEQYFDSSLVLAQLLEKSMASATGNQATHCAP